MNQKVSEVLNKASQAKEASVVLANIETTHKNKSLELIADQLETKKGEILKANKIDLENLTKKDNYSKAFFDRLQLTPERIAGMAEGLREISALPDPIGEIVSMSRRPNGLNVGQIRVPLGVIGIIYEARPNVTIDAAGLTLKSGNAVILRGSSEAINSNKTLVKILQDALDMGGLPKGAVALIEDTSRAAAVELMRLNKYLDVLIPRGGESLIQAVANNATVPVIETGVGNCHTYIDKDADPNMAVEIAINAKTNRPGVCNAMETLLVHKDIAETVLPKLLPALAEKKVEIRGCEKTCKYYSDVIPATEEDWKTEYLDMFLAVRVVDDFEIALKHINQYGTGHSEAIVTNNYQRAMNFLNRVDAAAVYVNASTRFTDGFEFGLGAEMGISTQKLHARGPMGLKELTTLKFIVFGSGQIR